MSIVFSEKTRRTRQALRWPFSRQLTLSVGTLLVLLAVWWLVPHIETETTLFRAVWLMIFLGGVGRLTAGRGGFTFLHRPSIGRARRADTMSLARAPAARAANPRTPMHDR